MGDVCVAWFYSDWPLGELVVCLFQRGLIDFDGILRTVWLCTDLSSVPSEEVYLILMEGIRVVCFLQNLVFYWSDCFLLEMSDWTLMEDMSVV